MISDTTFSELWKHDDAFGRRYVVGADEAGRGAWAGPIVGAAVALDLTKVDRTILAALDDSKKLTAKKRAVLLEGLVAEEKRGHLRIVRCIVQAQEIDTKGIQASNLKVLANPLREASEGLIDAICLVDAFAVSGAKNIIKGDSKSAAIAAASIVAKQLRDSLMQEASGLYPVYGFEGHKGYGAKTHSQAIQDHGICPLHRRSFKLPGIEKIDWRTGKALEQGPDKKGPASGGGFTFNI